MRALSLAVVGIRYPNKKRGNRQFEIAVCQAGEPVTLEPEPNNPADADAIKVISSRGIQMGYIAADRTWMIHRAWRDGREVRAIFQNAYPHGCWIRVGFDQEPMLPPMTTEIFVPDNRVRELAGAVDFDSGFYPDEVYPDE